MDEKVFALLMQQINERKNGLVAALQAGSAKDYADYKYLCGEVRGLLVAQAYLEDLAKRLENDDD